MAADNMGIAAWGKYSKHMAGFEDDWATGSLVFLGTRGCTEVGF
jgi:hypothetical protein